MEGRGSARVEPLPAPGESVAAFASEANSVTEAPVDPGPPPLLEGGLSTEYEARKVKRDLIKEAKSLAHLLDHSRFNPYCSACVWARSQSKGNFKGQMGKNSDTPSKFGDSVTGDHFLNRRKDNLEGFGEDFGQWGDLAKTAVVLYDRGTQWVEMFPKATRGADDTIKALNDFAGSAKIASFRSDNAGELAAAAEALG